MLDLIVLGRLPGTNIELGFIPIMILFEIGFVAYLIKTHPIQTRKVLTFIKVTTGKKKNQLVRSISRIRHNIFSPKAKLLK